MRADAIARPHDAAGPEKAGDLYNKALLYSLLLFAFFCPISIGGAQAAGALTFIIWLGGVLRLRLPEQAPPFLAPLALFLGLTLVAVVFSTDPLRSLYNVRSLVIFLVIPVVTSVVNTAERARSVLIAFAAGGLFTTAWGAYGVLAGNAGGESGTRLTGFLGHYMTAGGVLMLVTLAMLAAAVLASRRWERIAAIAAAAGTAAGLGLAQTRNAYVGLAMGVIALLFAWRPGIVALLPFVLSLAVLLSPPIVRERIFSIVDLEDESIQSRFVMADNGVGIIADFPIFGAGPQQVQQLYQRYKASEQSPDVPHLHNNFLQIAAERGLPALAAWIWLMIAFGVAPLRIARNPDAKPWHRVAALAAFCAVAALLVAGLFEYNFGDAEVLTLFLFIAVLPYGIAPSEAPAG